jgi:hypothetical protein
MDYLNSYSSLEINANKLIERVSLIIEYVKKCLEKIEKIK